ncbi:MAG: deoxyribose-phosphate aldolase [Saprospiraceae bacterium]|nr:deoxyribose-phosphate aldolase [Saprospiraceae bacterium]
MIKPEEINKYIDHTNLKADAGIDHIKVLCEEAIKYNFAAVCVPPYFIDHAKTWLYNSNVLLCTVISFPLGYQQTKVKIEECKKVIIAGADELDVVVNIAAIKSNDWLTIRNELENISTFIHLKKKVMKLIFETSYLTEVEIIKLCHLCVEFKIDFAKTSTGFSSEGATIHNVKLMKDNLGGFVKIKASGGIKSREMAIMMIDAGADRIGTSSGVSIVNNKY